MKECHYEASEAIFQSRNEQLKQMMKYSDQEALDLHGLHVAEAKRILKRELELRSASKTRGTRKVVYLLVGTGHHTKVSLADRFDLTLPLGSTYAFAFAECCSFFLGGRKIHLLSTSSWCDRSRYLKPFPTAKEFVLFISSLEINAINTHGRRFSNWNQNGVQQGFSETV